MIKIYRAVPKKGFDEKKEYTPQMTKRIPSNVPYIIDNIWEFLRPDNMPSRRFSAYASPTPELALRNASSIGINPEDYIVCKVVFNQEKMKIAHINVEDARYHQDISTIMRHVIQSLGKEFSNMSINEKIEHSALFLPAISKEESETYFNRNEKSKILLNEIREISTFWKDASHTLQNHNGELFFEISGTASYKLEIM